MPKSDAFYTVCRENESNRFPHHVQQISDAKCYIFRRETLGWVSLTPCMDYTAPITFCHCGVHGGKKEVYCNMWPKTGTTSDWRILSRGPYTMPLEATFLLVTTDTVFCPGIFIIPFSELHYCHIYQSEVSAPYAYFMNNCIHIQEGKYLWSPTGRHLNTKTLSAQKKWFMTFFIFHLLNSVEFINIFWCVRNIFKS